MRQANRRGVALIVVLWLLVLLGALLAEVAARTRLEADLLTSLRSRTVGRYAAESGILAAKVRIEALLDSTPGLAQRIAALHELGPRLDNLNDVSLGSGRFSVALVDLNARIDVNRADRATLDGLFREFTTDGRAEAAVTVLKQAHIRRLGELAHLPGIDDSLALAVAPYLTVWSDGFVNINAAPEPVLAALPGVSRAAIRGFVRRRDAGEVFLTTDPIRPQASTPPLSLMPTRILIVSRGWQAGHSLTHEIQAVYAIPGARLVLEAWQEHDR